jgi:hypothetical protein
VLLVLLLLLLLLRLRLLLLLPARALDAVHAAALACVDSVEQTLQRPRRSGRGAQQLQLSSCRRPAPASRPSIGTGAGR